MSIPDATHPSTVNVWPSSLPIGAGTFEDHVKAFSSRMQTEVDMLREELRASQAETRALRETSSVINRAVVDSAPISNTDIMGLLLSQQAAINCMLFKELPITQAKSEPIQASTQSKGEPIQASTASSHPLNPHQVAAALVLRDIFIYNPGARMSSQEVSKIVDAYNNQYPGNALASYQTDRARSKMMRSLQFERIKKMRAGDQDVRGWKHISLRPPKRIEEGVGSDQHALNAYPGHKRQGIPKKVKSDVWSAHAVNPHARQTPCYVCGVDIDCMHFTCGHVVASAQGGGDTVDNLRPICSPCNLSMGQRNLDEYKRAYYVGEPSTYDMH
jgi:hypothetical protein